MKKIISSVMLLASFLNAYGAEGAKVISKTPIETELNTVKVVYQVETDKCDFKNFITCSVGYNYDQQLEGVIGGVYNKGPKGKVNNCEYSVYAYNVYDGYMINAAKTETQEPCNPEDVEKVKTLLNGETVSIIRLVVTL